MLPIAWHLKPFITILWRSLLTFQEINARFHDRLPVPIPWELAVVIVSTIGTHFGHFFNYYGVIVVGEIPTGYDIYCNAISFTWSETWLRTHTWDVMLNSLLCAGVYVDMSYTITCYLIVLAQQNSCMHVSVAWEIENVWSPTIFWYPKVLKPYWIISFARLI